MWNGTDSPASLTLLSTSTHRLQRLQRPLVPIAQILQPSKIRHVSAEMVPPSAATALCRACRCVSESFKQVIAAATFHAAPDRQPDQSCVFISSGILNLSFVWHSLRCRFDASSTAAAWLMCKRGHPHFVDTQEDVRRSPGCPGAARACAELLGRRA